MADTEFKGKLTDASLSVRPDTVTDPEENENRVKSWDGVKRYAPPKSWVEITDWVEKQCDFTPDFDIEEEPVVHHWDALLPDFEGLDEFCYESTDYSTPDVYTTELPQKSGAFGDNFKPSKWYSEYLEEIKYGDGLNVYWHINAYNSKTRAENKTKRGANVGNLTKENCPNKKRGNALSDDELRERAKGTGFTARNARRELKKRGIV